MTIYDAIDGLIVNLLANRAAINANAHLAASGYQVLDAAGIAAGDTSPYRYIKVGDREALPDGLTLCYVPATESKLRFLGGDICEYEYTVQVIAYLQGAKDPAKAEQARRGIAEALRLHVNAVSRRNIATAAGTVYNSRMGAARFGEMWKMGGDKYARLVPAAMLTWTGLVYVVET